jgi:hypothetical protein
MSALGQKQPRRSFVGVSALPPKADIPCTGQLVAFLHCRCPALIDVGSKIDKLHAALGLLTRLDPHDGQRDIAAERLA